MAVSLRVCVGSGDVGISLGDSGAVVGNGCVGNIGGGGFVEVCGAAGPLRRFRNSLISSFIQ